MNVLSQLKKLLQMLKNVLIQLKRKFIVNAYECCDANENK